MTFNYHYVGPEVICKGGEPIAKGNNEIAFFLSSLQPNGSKNEVVLCIVFHGTADGDMGGWNSLSTVTQEV